MIGLLAGLEITLDAGTLLLMADVALELEPLVIKFATEHLKSRETHEGQDTYFESSCSNQISLVQFTQV
jgi:hypothetical protein